MTEIQGPIRVERFEIASSEVDQTFAISVMYRLDADPERPPPIVYATDANMTFEMFKSIACLLQLRQVDAPPFVLVGIGYPSDASYGGIMLRIRDFTVPPYPKWGPNWRTWFDSNSEIFKAHKGDILMPREGMPAVQGGQAFLRFIETELIPDVESRFACDPSRRIYFGHSGGGFFGLHTLFNHGHLFSDYIVSSPGIHFHGTAPGGVDYCDEEFGIKMLRDFLDRGGSLAGKRLYLSAGLDEEFEASVAPFKITSSVLRFAKSLFDASIEGLETKLEIHPDESHTTVWPIAFTHGLQMMLGTRQVRPAIYRP